MVGRVGLQVQSLSDRTINHGSGSDLLIEDGFSTASGVYTYDKEKAIR